MSLGPINSGSVALTSFYNAEQIELRLSLTIKPKHPDAAGLGGLKPRRGQPRSILSSKRTEAGSYNRRRRSRVPERKPQRAVVSVGAGDACPGRYPGPGGDLLSSWVGAAASE